jgi:hypothetical protein
VLKKSGIPIIFYHVGDFWKNRAKELLDVALCQATLASPHSDVILLTDEITPRSFALTQAAVADYSADVASFEKDYVHTSINNELYELHCFTRWFVIREFVRRNRISQFCIFDTDILLFSPAEHFAREFAGYAAGNWPWSNFFSDVGALDIMCDYFHDVFRDRNRLMQLADQQKANVGQPHMSDMVLLFELAKSNPKFLDQNGFPHKGYDSNIRHSNGEYFVMDGPIKLLTIGPDRIPVAYRSRDNAPVPFHTLHFQGQTKLLMGRFAWTMPPESESLFKLARNSPCPCTSGKRYKNCHGAL